MLDLIEHQHVSICGLDLEQRTGQTWNKPLCGAQLAEEATSAVGRESCFRSLSCGVNLVSMHER